MAVAYDYHVHTSLSPDGVSSMEDLRCLYEAGIKGAIIGKALYEKRVDLREAVRAFQ